MLSIILILAAMALTQYRNSVQYAKEAALRSDLYLMRDAIDQYYADKGKYPETLDALVTERYLRAIPRDPITASTDTWQTEQAERDAGAVASQAGIINVKSGVTGHRDRRQPVRGVVGNDSARAWDRRPRNDHRRSIR